MAASATSLRAALRLVPASSNPTTQLPTRRLISMPPQLCKPCLRLQALQPARAVADAVLVNAEHIEDAQQQIPGRHGFGRIRQMTPALELPIRSSEEHVRGIFMTMLVGVPHVGA